MYDKCMGFFGFSFQKKWPFFTRQPKEDKFERVWNFLTVALVIGFLLFKIGQIPVGMFTDEAIIGFRAQQLLDGETEAFLTPFYYQHFNYILPTLSVGATVPFVGLFGLSEFSVRLASIFFGLLSLFFVYKTLRILQLEWRWPVIALAFTPLFFHLSRVNFGNAISFCCVAAGLFFYARHQQSKNFSNLIGSGIMFGLGTYANVSGLILVPIIVGSLSLSHLILKKKLPKNCQFLSRAWFSFSCYCHICGRPC